MTKRVYCREAIYREEYIVDVPDNLPEEEWEEYVLEELKALDRDPDDTKFSEYLTVHGSQIPGSQKTNSQRRVKTLLFLCSPAVILCVVS